ncbi:P68 family surface lipoprotein [Metamycoplasma neophronis]|uniref:P80 family lipoprotein n=1 Tax=Metamycoplasma neophronis TaxID=872983 RepID=A0ABY2Z0H2_9BACT|nr:P80 family lipoprotein [Metamycoplasma neophronis]TPR54651.1 hypothetical protein FJR74_00035 [Metamycoplasma neophronis]
MKKINKVLLGLAPIASAIAIAPIAASCGGGGTARFDQDLDNKIVLATGFAKDGQQAVALQSIVDYYNEHVNKDAGWKVTVNYLANGYNTDSLSAKLNAKDNQTFWNVLINYPAAASIIASYDMNLAIPNDMYESFGFAPAFKNVNSTIAGAKNGEKLVAPMSRSTEMITVSKILLGKLLDELHTLAEVPFGSNVTLINKYIDYSKSQVEERAFVDSVWTEQSRAEINEELKAKIKELVPAIDDSIFNSYESLIKMAIAIKKIYANNPNLYVLGMDSVPNAINTMVGAADAGNASKGYVTPDAENAADGGWDYTTFIENPKSTQRAVFKAAADIIIEGIKNKALWIGGNGSYGSGNLISYKLAMSMGSTAGWDKTFVSSSKAINNYYIKGTSDSVDIADTVLTTDPVAKSVKENDKAYVAFQVKSGKYVNQVYKSTVPDFSKVSSAKHQYKLSAALTSEDMSAYAGWYFVPAKSIFTVKNGKLEVSYKNNTNADQTLEIPAGKFVELPNVTKGTTQAENYFLISPEFVEVKQQTQTSVVNEADADWIGSPFSKEQNSPHKAVFVQGPSMIGIHSNKQEDEKTLSFMDWFFKGTIPTLTITYRPKGQPEKVFTKENVKPIDMFNYVGGYVSPTNSFFQSNPEQFGLNTANTLAFNQFNLINSQNHDGVYVPAEDVASVKSNPLRDSITSAALGLFSKAASSPGEVTFESFITNISNGFNI